MARDSITRDGEEIVVETGTGLIQKIDHEAGKRNAQIVFRATHANLRDPITGWFDTIAAADGVLDALRDAMAEGVEVEYRIEVHRKANVDKTIPLADVPTRDRVRDLVTVARRGSTQASPPPDRPAQAPQQPPAPPRRGKVEEARPWEELNSDGTPNLGSYAVLAGAGIVDLAVEILVAADAPLRLDAIETVAVDLMAAADAIQAGSTGQRADRMDNSHSRARGILRTVLRPRPYPVADVVDEHGEIRKTAAKAVQEWHEKVAKAGVALFTMAVRVSGVDWRDAS